MLAQIILQILMSQGSKKAVYFFYSADLGGALLIGLVFLIFGRGDGALAFIVAASYVAYFFNVGRKEHTEESVGQFATNLLKWSAISIPVDLALAGLPFLILFGGSAS